MNPVGTRLPGTPLPGTPLPGAAALAARPVQALRALLPFVRPYRRQVLLALGFLGVAALTWRSRGNK